MPDTRDKPAAEAKLQALLADHDKLVLYLQEGGQHTNELAQRFLENADRNPSARV